MEFLTTNDEQEILTGADAPDECQNARDFFTEADHVVHLLQTINENQRKCENDDIKTSDVNQTPEQKVQTADQKSQEYPDQKVVWQAVSDEIFRDSARKAEEIKKIWNSYQEQSGLLDSHLQKMVIILFKTLMENLDRKYCAISGANSKLTVSDVLSRHENLTCSLLYFLCAVRGYKRVVTCFPHEVGEFLPLLELLEFVLQRLPSGNKDTKVDEISQSTKTADENITCGSGVNHATLATSADPNVSPWPTRYVLYLWLSMVLYSPFDLDSIFEGRGGDAIDRVLKIANVGLSDTGRIRDASAFMIGKLFARKDVGRRPEKWKHFILNIQQQLQNPEGKSAEVLKAQEQAKNQEVLLSPATDALLRKDGVMSLKAGTSTNIGGSSTPVPVSDNQPNVFVSTFQTLGSLQAVHQILKNASSRADNATTELQTLFEVLISTREISFFERNPLAWKLRLKTLARIVEASLPRIEQKWRYQQGVRMLESNLLVGVASKSTIDTETRSPNTGTSSTEDESDKSQVKLPVVLMDSVEKLVDMLLQSLNHNDTIVRWSAAKCIGRLCNLLPRELACEIIDAVESRCFADDGSGSGNNRGWHGGCLALAELARRGLLLPERLDQTVPRICDALHFEICSSSTGSGASFTGQHVRDAACYCVWAFARAYQKQDLKNCHKRLATALVPTACFDRDVNIRRAAAAAAQEHVGRQSSFEAGISLITIADFFMVSCRKRSYSSVAKQIANLSPNYRSCLILHLLQHKMGHGDPVIREQSAVTMGNLLKNADPVFVDFANEVMVPLLCDYVVPDEDKASKKSKSSALSIPLRHGSFLTLAEMVSSGNSISYNEESRIRLRNLVPKGEKQRIYRGRGGETLRYGAMRLLRAVCSNKKEFPFPSSKTARYYLQSIEECLHHAGDARIQVVAMEALEDLLVQRLSVSNDGDTTNADDITDAEKLEMISEFVVRQTEKLSLTRLAPLAVRNGAILGLGLALLYVKDLALRKKSVEVLCNEILSTEIPADTADPVTRQYAVFSLGRIIAAMQADHGMDIDRFLQTLVKAGSDYAVDRRGDVGSWVREMCLDVMCILYQKLLILKDITDNRRDILLSKILPQCVEKIDRTRIVAFSALVRIVRAHEFHKMMKANHKLKMDQYPMLSLRVTAKFQIAAAAPRSHAKEPLTNLLLASRNWTPDWLYFSESRSKLELADDGDVVMKGDSPEVDSPTKSEKTVDLVIPNYTESNTESSSEPACYNLPKGLFSAVRSYDVDGEDECGVFLFKKLIFLLDDPSFCDDMMEALVASGGGVTESTAKAASAALIGYIKGESMASTSGQKSKQAWQEPDVEMQDSNTMDLSTKREITVSKSLCRLLQTAIAKNIERLQIPLLNVAGLLLEQGYYSKQESDCDELFKHSYKLQCTKKSNVAILRSVLTCYIGMLQTELQSNENSAPSTSASSSSRGQVCPSNSKATHLRRKALKCVLQLCWYRFPKVREASAQALYIYFLTVMEDWSFLKSETGGEITCISPATIQEACDILVSTQWVNEEPPDEIREALYGKFQLTVPLKSSENAKKGKAGSVVKSGVVKALVKNEVEGYAQLVHEFHNV